MFLLTDIDLRGQEIDAEIIDTRKVDVAPCVGCFGCWIKTPGQCVRSDDAAEIAKKLAQAEQVVYVTRVRCGCYDIPMKTVLERMLPMQQAFLRIHEGEVHHVQRDVAKKEAIVIAYGAKDEEEQTVFKHMIARNAKNMNWVEYRVVFCEESEAPTRTKEEIATWKY